MFIGILLTSALVLGLFFLYFIYITSPKKGSQRYNTKREYFNPQVFQIKWTEISAMMQAGGPANYKQSIMEADKLVDLALKSKVSGETMGERLKNARNLFSHETYNDLWSAHKIRNKLAHEADFEGLSSDANFAVKKFEKALKELRVI